MPESTSENAGTTPGGGAGTAAPVAENAARHFLKATHVPLKTGDAGERGGALIKHAFVRQLNLQPGEVDRVHGGSDSTPRIEPATGQTYLDVLKGFENPALPGLLPPPGAFADIQLTTLTDFGERLIELRKQALTAGTTGGATTDIAPAYAMGAAQAAGQQLLNSAVNALKLVNAHAHPIGMLNLERLEMAPAGIERGELIGTVPLAPLEETSVSTKEWSVTSKEFTSIVTDSLENYSENGVTDNTELSQGTTSQSQHSNQFNVTGTVSGGNPMVSASLTTTFGSQDSQSASATESRKHAQSLTQKASARSRKEHKTTVSITTVTGSSETTTRTIKNPSTTDAMRVDYFSMMRKWRVRLYRYGLRLTYDVVVPEPGAAVRAGYAELADLKRRLGPFTFPVKHSDITDHVLPGETQPHYLVLADQFQAEVPDPPKPSVRQTFPPDSMEGGGGRRAGRATLRVPDGYEVVGVTLSGHLSSVSGPMGRFTVEGSTVDWGPWNYQEYHNQQLYADGGGGAYFLAGTTGSQVIVMTLEDVATASLLFTAEFTPTYQRMAQWRSDVWAALYNAAQNRYQAEQQDIASRIAALQDQLEQVDTLTLRREESDEVMKTVLRYLLGTDFEFMPDAVRNAFPPGTDLAHGVGPDGNRLAFNAYQWSTLMQHEDEIKFINEAIEWENVVTYLYSYFWDVPESWNFIRQIKHPDKARQAFLRAGSARVVLTVRKGWEEAWIRYVEGGFEGIALDADHPYLTIAQEIAAYDDRNYPGIPPANPGQTAARLEDAIVTTSDARVGPSPNPVTLPITSSKGFVVGHPVVIDVATLGGVQEAPLITAIPDDTHLTVAHLDHAHDGSGTPFPVVQPGEKGALIAEWFEYTPSSGTDIQLNTHLTDVS